MTRPAVPTADAARCRPRARRKRPYPARPGRAALVVALTAALAIPVLAITGAAAMAAISAGATAHKISTQQSAGRDAGRVGAAVAATASRTVLAWGSNESGELGNGTTTDSSDTPVRVALPSGWRASAVGGGPGAGHILAIVHKKP